ncbi:MAG: 50S ribosomal protein L25 [bacterium]|nr:50S ribosomal protein L25 [bacterium]
MDSIQLRVETRETLGSKKSNVVRQSGKIPAVLYGHKVKNRSLLAGRSDFLRLYHRAGESTLIDLVVDSGAPVKALIQDVQVDPLTQQPIHVDFRQVNLKEKITARIKLRFIGVSQAVKEHGGVLMTNLSDLEVSCLPQDLVGEIVVDISALKTFDDYLHVKDLALPTSVTPTAKPEEVVAHVIPPRSEEELKALDTQPAAAAPAEVPVAGKEQKEENAAEGAAAGTSPAAKT